MRTGCLNDIQGVTSSVLLFVLQHITMCEFVNLEDTIDVTFSNVTDNNTSPFLPTFHIMI